MNFNYEYKTLRNSNKGKGSYLILTVRTTLQKLIDLFGYPDDPSADGKTQCNWTIELDDGTVFTIYDWKEYGNKPEYVTYWHIGGQDKDLHTVRLFLFNQLQLEEGK